MGKRNKPSPFELIKSNLSAEENTLLDNFFHRVRCSLRLSYKHEKAMLADFENAFCHYLSNGISAAEAAERLSWEKLGDFYKKEREDWYPLDSAGQIYPLSMSAHRMSVFRLSLYFDAPIVPELLQMALNFSIKRFPVFATVLRRGFFWYYLEGDCRHWHIQREHTIPCAPMRLTSKGDMAFRVLYYQHRLSIEFFHVLTDGTGGSIFLATLAGEYLRLLGKNVPAEGLVRDISAECSDGEMEDTFANKDIREKNAAALSEPAAVRLKGSLAPTNLAQVVHFSFSAAELVREAKSHGATVTAFITAAMFLACRRASSGKGMLKIQVPINLRRFYPSCTLRNFSFYAVIRIPRTQAYDFSAVLNEVKKQMAEAVRQENIDAGLAVPNKMVRSVRLVPLFLKRPCARAAYRLVGDKTLTNTLSNLGVLALPEELADSLCGADFVLGTTVSSRAACAMVTVGDKAVFTISKLTADPSFQIALYSVLHEMGLDVQVDESPLYCRKK